MISGKGRGAAEDQRYSSPLVPHDALNFDPTSFQGTSLYPHSNMS